MGAYVTFDPVTCQVHRTRKPQTGASQYYPSVAVGWSMQVEAFNRSHPGINIPVPNHCKVNPPSGQTGKGIPTQGGGSVPPEEPPPEDQSPPPEDKCAPPAPIDDYTTDADFDIGDHWEQPVVGKFRAIPIVTSMDDDGPVMTSEAQIRRNENGEVRVYKKGSGPGWLANLPPELEEHHVYGDKGASGTNDLAAIPTRVSESGLLLLSYTDADGFDDTVQQILAWGKVVARSDGSLRPASGWYAKLDNANGDLCWQATDANGDDTNTPDFKVNGSPVKTDSTLFPLQAPDNTAVPQYSFDNASVPGSDGTGMFFDQVSLEGPAFKSINGDVQLTIRDDEVVVTDKLTVGGLIDPTGLELTQQASNPGGVAANTLWQDSSNGLFYRGGFLLEEPTRVIRVGAERNYTTIAQGLAAAAALAPTIVTPVYVIADDEIFNLASASTVNVPANTRLVLGGRGTGAIVFNSTNTNIPLFTITGNNAIIQNGLLFGQTGASGEGIAMSGGSTLLPAEAIDVRMFSMTTGVHITGGFGWIRGGDFQSVAVTAEADTGTLLYGWDFFTQSDVFTETGSGIIRAQYGTNDANGVPFLKTRRGYLALDSDGDAKLVGGGRVRKVDAHVANHTLNNEHQLYGNTTGGAFSYTLPAAADVVVGRSYSLKNIGTGGNALTIARDNAGDTINGSTADITLADNEVTTIVARSVGAQVAWETPAAGGTGDMLGANNLSDVANAATSRANIGAGTGDGDVVGPAGATNDALARYDGATGQLIQNSGVTLDDSDNMSGVNSLSLTTDLAIAHGGTGASTEDQALENLIGSATSETDIVAADQLPMVDVSGSHGANITWNNVIKEGKATVIEYTGSGVSGKTVTLTGINRAHYIVVVNLRNTGRTAVAYPVDGATGTLLGRRWDGNPEQSWMSLDAPAAGTAQTLTINTTDVTVNENTYTHKIYVVGTPV